MIFPFAQVSSISNYTLNHEVKTATPSLKTAAQIGVLQFKNEDPAFKNLEDKIAMVVMSFGTTHQDTRAKNIDATVQDIQAANPQIKIVTAFTSHIVIERIAKSEGIQCHTPEQVLEFLKSDGFTQIALVSLDIIPGIEYEYTKAVFHNYKNQFKAMTLSTPLLYWQGQNNQADDVTDFITAFLTPLKKSSEEAILLMAHGTPHPANAYYSVIQAKLEEMGFSNVFVYTVEGCPRLENVIPKLKMNKIKNVKLIPLMLVAGEHALNDMAGNDHDSHKNILIKAGFKVAADLRGLGENAAVRALYVRRAMAALFPLLKNKKISEKIAPKNIA